MRRERRLADIERVDEHLVEAEIAGQGEAPIRRRIDRMATWHELLQRRVAIAFVLDEAAGSALHHGLQAAVGFQAETDHAATPEIGGEDDASRAIDRQVARARAAGRLLVFLREAARLFVDRERDDRARRLAGGIGHFRDGVENRQLRMQGEERRVLRLGREFRHGELAGGGVEPRDIDARALRGAAGVGAEPDQLARELRFVGPTRRGQTSSNSERYAGESDDGQKATQGNETDGRHQGKASCCEGKPRNHLVKSYPHDRELQRAGQPGGE